MASLMLRMNAIFGGEGNGGIMNPDVHIGRDSLVGTVMVLQFLSDWRNGIGHFSLEKKQLEASDEEDVVPSLPFTQPNSPPVPQIEPALPPPDKKDRTISALKMTLPQYEIVKDKIPLTAETTPEQIESMLKTVEEEWKDKFVFFLVPQRIMVLSLSSIHSVNQGNHLNNRWLIHRSSSGYCK